MIESCNGHMEDIVKITIYLRDADDLDRVNTVYREYFKPGQEPARVTIQASSPIRSIDVEIEAIAAARG